MMCIYSFLIRPGINEQHSFRIVKWLKIFITKIALLCSNSIIFLVPSATLLGFTLAFCCFFSALQDYFSLSSNILHQFHRFVLLFIIKLSSVSKLLGNLWTILKFYIFNPTAIGATKFISFLLKIC